MKIVVLAITRKRKITPHRENSRSEPHSQVEPLISYRDELNKKKSAGHVYK